MDKKLITLLVVPLFAITACSSEDSESSFATPASEVTTTTEDGSIANADLLKAYSNAVQNGYTGSIEEFVALTKTFQTDPQQALQTAQASGFNGNDMLLGAVAGMALGSLLNSNSHSSNYAQNYSASSRDDRRTTTGSAVTTPARVGTSAVSSNPVTRTVTTTRPTNIGTSVRSSPMSVARSTPAARSVAVSRGGFGGAVSSGG